MSKKQIALIVLLVIVAGLVVAALVVNSKYEVLTASPRVSHDTFVKPETRAQIALNIPMARDIIKKRFLKGVNVPDWTLDSALPYEAALIINPDPILSEMNLSLFINDQRLAPFILDKANQFKLPAPLNEWFPDKMIRKDRGILIRNGVARMDRLVLSKIKAQWKNPPPTEALRLQNGHLFEVLLDNRDGSAVAIVGAIAATRGMDLGDLLNEGRLGVVANIAAIRFQADITPDNALKARAAIECTPETDDAQVKIIGMGLEMANPQIQNYAKMVGLNVQGRVVTEGKTVNDDLTIPNFDVVLALL